MSKTGLTQQDKKWRAECDVRTLASAQEIQKDPGRLKLAQAEAKAQVVQAQKVVTAVSKKPK